MMGYDADHKFLLEAFEDNLWKDRNASAHVWTWGQVKSNLWTSLSHKFSSSTAQVF